MQNNIRVGIMRDAVNDSDKDLTRTVYAAEDTIIADIHSNLIQTNWFPEGYSFEPVYNKELSTIGELSCDISSAVIRYRLKGS